LYTIHAHALKSAFANIGATELSETAKTLESAGENRDVDFIETHTPVFLMALDSFLKKIDDALKRRMQNSVKRPYNTELLKFELTKLKAALENLDAGIINMSIQELLKQAQADDIGATINNISDRILFGDYDEAAAIIENLLQEKKI